MECPICHKPAMEKYTSFCSKRCADVDLNRWFIGNYAVAAVENNEEEQAIDEHEDENE